MKNQIAICLIILFSSKLIAQENTFPTSGNVGINDATPTEKLVVNGNVKIDSCLIVQDSAYFQQRLYVQGPLKVDGTARFQSDIEVYGITRSKSDIIVDGNTTLSGDLTLNGLGTYSGDFSEIEVLIKTSDGNITRTPILPLLSQTYFPFTCTEDFLEHPMWRNGLNKIYIDCTPVNVGIGTSSPNHKLDVRGRIFGYEALIGNQFASHDATLNVFVPNPSGDIIRFGKKIGAEPEEVYFKITNDGKVWATEINVDVKEDFPDYVFLDSYQLMGIDNVQDFVNKNGHLPNMPSAKHVAENGLNIAKFEVQQTEKIEELYLYMFELNQQMKELKDEVNSLKTENESLKEEIETLK